MLRTGRAIMSLAGLSVTPRVVERIAQRCANEIEQTTTNMAKPATNSTSLPTVLQHWHIESLT